MSTVTAGQKAPLFELQGVNGRQHSLPEALARGPLLAAFFKVACPTCQYTFPFMERLYQRLRAHGGQIWGISQDNVPDSQRFAKECGVTFPLLIDDYPHKISRAYGVKYVPTLFLIASDGRVELTSDGFCKADLLKIQQALANHLSASPPALFLPRDRVPEYKPG